MTGDSDLARAVCQGLTNTGQNAIEAGAQISAATYECALVCKADSYFVIDTFNIDLAIGNLGGQPTADLLIFTLSNVLTLLSI